MTKKVKNTLAYTQKKILQPLGDLLLGKLMSRKLTVFFISTIFAWNNIISGKEWVFIACIYMLGLVYLNYLREIAKTKLESTLGSGVEGPELGDEDSG